MELSIENLDRKHKILTTDNNRSEVTMGAFGFDENIVNSPEKRSLFQKKIDAFAQKRLSHLQAKTFPFEIINCIADFRTDLADHNIIINEIEDKKVMHSKKIFMDLNLYFQVKNMIQFSSKYFGAEYCYVKNHKLGSGIIFIGDVNNIYATQILFDCLRKIATEIRQTYIKRLKHYKKQSTKDKQTDEYMDEWFESLIENVNHDAWYDTSCCEYFSDYVRKHFKTFEDERKMILRAIEIIKPIYDINDEFITWEEFKKEVFKTFPEKLIKQTIKEFDEIRTQDIVIIFSAEESIDEDYAE